MQRKKFRENFKDIEQTVWCKGRWYLRPSERVPANELDKVCDAITLWCLAIGDSIGWRAWDKRTRDTWLCALRECTLVLANDFFKSVDSALCRSFTYEDFRSRIRSQCTGCFKALLAPFQWRIREWFNIDMLSYPASLKELRTCFLWISHLTVKSNISKEESLKKWQDNQERLRTFSTLPSMYQKLRTLEVNLPKPWTRIMSHGPGSVSELITTESGSLIPLSEYDKWIACNTPAVRYVLSKYYKASYLPNWDLAPTNRTSRYILVPKGLGEWRSISPEPAALMFMQQGLARSFDFRVTQLRSRCSLEHQEYSSDLARRGSVTGKFACIDLSMASDSVRWNWVEALFQQRKDWLKALSLCRSTRTLMPDESLVDNYHFAPMGSAMCFPMESFVFCMFVEESFYIEKVPLSEPYRVYGDDLVVPDQVFGTLCALLEDNGFVVNRDKSFSSADPPFREACGGHWYAGADVAPIRVSRKFLGFDSADVTSYSKSIDLCNRCKALLPSVRLYALDRLMSRWDCIPFTNDVEDISRVYTEQEPWSCDQRLILDPDLWGLCPDTPCYQASESLCLGITTDKRSYKRPFLGDIGFFKWLMASEEAGHSIPESQVIETCNSRTKLATQWRYDSRPKGGHLQRTDTGKLYLNL